MNTLSWLLYATEVIGDAKGVMVVVAVASGLSAAALAICAGVVSTAMYNDGDRDMRNWLGSRIKPFAISCVVFSLIAAAVPSRNTVMLIAASEVGGALMATEQAAQLGGEAGALATDSMRVLRKFINEQLNEKGTAE